MKIPIDIVAFAVPDPPHYGGVIDVFYRLKALKSAGLDVRLHCFVYGQHKRSEPLEQLVGEVYYYRRPLSRRMLLSPVPFIVRTRMDDSLLRNLSAGEGPILLEGLHCCGFIQRRELSHRPMLVRTHNVEWQYYRHLSQTAGNLARRVFFKIESWKLRRFEDRVIQHADVLLPISSADVAYYSAMHDRVVYLPPFHPHETVDVAEGVGTYALWHGDLRIGHNVNDVLRIAPVCLQAGMRLVIAGKGPAPASVKKIARHENIELKQNVSTAEMAELMRGAQIHIVEATNPGGFKIKLLTALFTGRHVAAREAILPADLRMVAHGYNDLAALRQILVSLRNQPVSSKRLAERKSVLLQQFSNTVNARKLVELITQFA